MPGLDREPGAGNQPALVVGFVVVHVCAVSVDFLPQAVPRAMDELLAESRPVDHVARRAVHFVAPQLPTVSSRSLHRLDCGIASITGGRKHGARTRSGTTGPVNPIQVMSAKTAPGTGSFPQRSSSTSSFLPIVAADGRGGLIVWIAGVLLSCHARRRIAYQPFLAKPSHHGLLYREFD